MATGPQPGDLIIRNTANEHFEVFAVDGKHLAGPFESFPAAHAHARVVAKGADVWQQMYDHRLRPMGQPLLIPPLP